MQILLVAERYYPEVGAAPTRLTNLADGLRRQGAEVDVLTSLPNYPQGRIYDGYRGRIHKHEKINGGDVFRYWAYATVSQSPVKRALNMVSFAMTIWLFAFRIGRIRRYDCVIINTPTLFMATSAMWIFKRLYGRKVLLNVSDIWPSTAVDMGAMKEGGRAHKVMSWCEKYLYRKADGISGQSREILDRVNELPNAGKTFLYRNLHRCHTDIRLHEKGTPLKVCFAGMLGVAQDVLSIAKNIDFKEMGVEFHIIGGGNQFDALTEYVRQNKDGNVFMHGVVAKEKMEELYKQFDASLVPLTTRIRGAFPSKIFDILPMGIPVLFCGGGEGAGFVESHKVGYVSAPGDYSALQKNIERIRDLSLDEYNRLSAHCINTARGELDFDRQIQECYQFIKDIC